MLIFGEASGRVAVGCVDGRRLLGLLLLVSFASITGLSDFCTFALDLGTSLSLALRAEVSMEVFSVGFDETPGAE